MSYPTGIRRRIYIWSLNKCSFASKSHPVQMITKYVYYMSSHCNLTTFQVKNKSYCISKPLCVHVNTCIDKIFINKTQQDNLLCKCSVLCIVWLGHAYIYYAMLTCYVTRGSLQTASLIRECTNYLAIN